MIIYLITNNLNGRKYVGQTIHPLERRWGRHLYTARTRPSSLLHRDIRRCGEESFTISVLEKTDSSKKLHALETHYIKTLNTLFPGGYNLTTGGQGHTISEETKKKISKANKGKQFRLGQKSSPEHCQKISAALTGKIHSEETKKKISLAKTNPSAETRKRLRESHLGHKPSEETRQKMRDAQRRRYETSRPRPSES